MSTKFDEILPGESFMWRKGLYTKTYAWLAHDMENNPVMVHSKAKVKRVKKTPYWKVLLYNWFTVISYYLRMKV